MKETTERLLAVLSALQSRPHWSGPDLAAHLDVTVRTIRRDVDRLRSLGYAIDSEIGTAGGYRLGVGGSASPPLMLDADEAVAIAISLRASPAANFAAAHDAVARVLRKLEQITPTRIRPHLAAIENATVTMPRSGAALEPDVFVAISRACRMADVVTIRYRDARGTVSERTIEPFRSVHAGRNWYVVARDRDAARRPDDDGWRTLRLDRISDVRETGHRAEHTDPPDPVPFVQRGISTAPYAHHARIELSAPIEHVMTMIPSNVGVLEQVDDTTTMFTTGSDDLDMIVLHLARLDLAFRVIEPLELRDRLAVLADRLLQAAAASMTRSTPVAVSRSTAAGQRP